MHLTDIIESRTPIAIHFKPIELTAEHLVVEIGASKIDNRTTSNKTIRADQSSNLFFAVACCPITHNDNAHNTTNNVLDISTALMQLKDFVKDNVLIVYKLEATDKFTAIKQLYHQLDNPTLNTLEIAKSIFKDKVQDYSISRLLRLFGIYADNKNALDMASSIAKLFNELAQRDDFSHCHYLE